MADINTAALINLKTSLYKQVESMSLDNKGAASFNQIMQQTLNRVNDQMMGSDNLKTRFELGDPNVSIADVMVAGQKSNLAFEATLRVRNKLVQAYKEIMDMPV